MSVKINCPSCGAAVDIQASIAVFTTCKYCKSSLMRQGVNWERFGSIGELMMEETPLQIGSRGSYRGEAFYLCGRIQKKWERGFWSEWCADFFGKKFGWIAQAQGEISISFEVQDFKPKQKFEEFVINQSLFIPNFGSYSVQDKKIGSIASVEGDLPFQVRPGTQIQSIDLIRENQFACIEYSDGEISTYTGANIRFEDLRLTGLKALEGWN